MITYSARIDHQEESVFTARRRRRSVIAKYCLAKPKLLANASSSKGAEGPIFSATKWFMAPVVEEATQDRGEESPGALDRWRLRKSIV
jgi:hypothetical protein